MKWLGVWRLQTGLAWPGVSSVSPTGAKRRQDYPLQSLQCSTCTWSSNLNLMSLFQSKADPQKQLSADSALSLPRQKELGSESELIKLTRHMSVRARRPTETAELTLESETSGLSLGLGRARHHSTLALSHLPPPSHQHPPPRQARLGSIGERGSRHLSSPLASPGAMSPGTMSPAALSPAALSPSTSPPPRQQQEAPSAPPLSGSQYPLGGLVAPGTSSALYAPLARPFSE